MGVFWGQNYFNNAIDDSIVMFYLFCGTSLPLKNIKTKPEKRKIKIMYFMFIF